MFQRSLGTELSEKRLLCSRLRVVLKLRYWYARLIQNLGEH